MPLGNFTRVNLEAQASEIAKTIFAMFDEAELLRSRAQAEFAAGTLDSAEFYPTGDPVAQTAKANLLGSLDDLHAIYGGIKGTALPTLDYRRYLNFLIGI